MVPDRQALWNTGARVEGFVRVIFLRRNEESLTTTRAVFAAAVTLSAALLVGVTGGRAATGPAQVRITDLQVSYHLVRPSNGAVVGSTELIRQRLYNPQISAETRSGARRCSARTLDRRERSCTATYVLPKGSLVVTGAIESRLLYEIAIVGGTGLYRQRPRDAHRHLDPHQAPPRGAGVPSHGMTAARPRMLIVEDEQPLRELVVVTLE